VLKHGTREGKQKPARKGGFCKLSNHPCLCANLFRVPRHPRSLRSSPQRHLRLLIFSTPPRTEEHMDGGCRGAHCRTARKRASVNREFGGRWRCSFSWLMRQSRALPLCVCSPSSVHLSE
jgi:hypothetical protein